LLQPGVGDRIRSQPGCYRHIADEQPTYAETAALASGIGGLAQRVHHVPSPVAPVHGDLAAGDGQRVQTAHRWPEPGQLVADGDPVDPGELVPVLAGPDVLEHESMEEVARDVTHLEPVAGVEWCQRHQLAH